MVCAMAIVACSTSDDASETPSDGFDRQALLAQTADHIIIPAYEDLSDKLTMLEANVQAFTAAPDQAGLDAARNSWLEAYTVWQSVELYNIGRAEELLYRFQVNVYPTNVTDIQNNILSGNANLSSDSNNDAVGFPAIEYMLYGLGDAATMVDFYTTDTNATENAAYLNALTTRLKSLTNLNTSRLAQWLPR